MKKHFFSFLFLFVVLVGALVSCKSTNALPPTKTEFTSNSITKEVIHDTIFNTQKDSSYYKAWLECKEGKILFTSKPQKTAGKYLQPPKVIITDNVLEVDCEAEAQRLFAEWKDVYKVENQTTTFTNTVLTEKQLSGWQNFQIWSGRIFLVLLLIIIICTILRLTKII